MPRFFVSPSDFSPGAFPSAAVRVVEDAHHIKDVLRMQPGEKLTLCDGEGMDYACHILSLEEKEVLCRVDQVIPSASEPQVKVTLFQGVPKADKMEWIIEKGTEAGICTFSPVMMERCISRPDEKKQKGKTERWQKIALSAAKQSGRGKVPEVTGQLSWKEMLARFPGFSAVYICYEEEQTRSIKSELNLLQNAVTATGTNTATNAATSTPTPTAAQPLSIALVIGPEGGIAPEEVEQMKAKGGICVTLGPRILRTETAGVLGAAFVLYHLDQKEGS